MRDIFENHFHRAKVPAPLRTETVRRLANSIYTDGSFDRLPILGDALEEAGCTDTALLSHCRSDGPHVRGCWVVDLILGKT
jgi:hypothetical protein